jgi:predicted metal-dependent HD superfamily phosphohydrolase
MITINPSKTAEAKADACKAQAKQLLVDTDWSQNLDVAAVLTNKAAFDTYRAAVREIYFNPVAEPVWPERPEAVWESV